MAKATVTDEAVAFVFGNDDTAAAPVEPKQPTKRRKSTGRIAVKTKQKTTVKATQDDKSQAATVLFGDLAKVGKAGKPRTLHDRPRARVVRAVYTGSQAHGSD